MSHMIKDLKIALSASKQGSNSKLPMTTEALKLYQQVGPKQSHLSARAMHTHLPSVSQPDLAFLSSKCVWQSGYECCKWVLDLMQQ